MEGPNLEGSFHSLGLSFGVVDFSSPGPCVSTNLRTLPPPSLARDLAKIHEFSMLDTAAIVFGFKMKCVAIVVLKISDPTSHLS